MYDRTPTHEENGPFLDKAHVALRDLFQRAKAADELNFAFSLAPGSRPYSVSPVFDAHDAFKDYYDFLVNHRGEKICARIALAFYCHVSEASGFWEIPKNLLCIIKGGTYNPMPFWEFVRLHSTSGQLIAPNANKIMASIAGLANEIGLSDLAGVFRDAFDPDLRNGYAHADYAIDTKGVYVRARYEQARLIEWGEFNLLLDKGINFYSTLMCVVGEFMRQYEVPRVVEGRLNDRDPTCNWRISYDVQKGQFSIIGGVGLTADALHRIALGA